MPRTRPFSLLLVAAVAVGALVGCGDKGSYRLSWRFTDQPADAPTTGRDCGLRGVDAFSVAGDGDGETDAFVVPCGRLEARRSVSPGPWTLTAVALDRTGKVKEPSGMLLRAGGTFDVQEGGESTPVELVFTPQPQCRDGVDNDADGAVDVVDPACKGDPEGATE